MKRGQLDILLVEDDENGVFFVQEAIRNGGAGHAVHAVRDGEEAIRYLRGEQEYADRQKFPLPNIIMTNFKMPAMSGLELLRWLRTHLECSINPTIVYSGSAKRVCGRLSAWGQPA
ncbi:MAG TPA: response regulator [Candidatus Binatia bacterium]|nr:response regulator [Candidatus Binatia bacterium]